MRSLILRYWLPFVLPMGGCLAYLALARPELPGWQDVGMAFGYTVTATILCALGSAAVLVFGWRSRLAEVAMLGAALWVASVLPLAHGLLLPGVLYGDNPGTMVAAFCAAPLAFVAGAPLLARGSALGRVIGRRWRAWTATWVVLAIAIDAALLSSPSAVSAPQPGGPLVLAVIGVTLTAAAGLSLGQLRLFAVGRRWASLAASIGVISFGLSVLAFLGAQPYTAGWWLAHLADGVGVLLAAAGLLIAHHRDRGLADVLAPVLAREPLVALELGLTPVVHRFVAALERKDRVTRDHVVRVAELAMRAGQTAGFGPARLRLLGLGGLLHDVGKLLTPLEILTKPAALDPDERASIERHTVTGEALVSAWPQLREIAPIVRSHHERPDGQGYPDGLGANEIPIEAAIVAVADAWDAMTGDRPYRDGMPAERASTILRDGAGRQWPASAVDLVLAEAPDLTRQPVAPALDRVGRTRPATSAADANAQAEEADELLCGCLPPGVDIPS